MKARPILYSGPMVRAMLREVDPKSQTRRIMKPQPHPNGFIASTGEVLTDNDYLPPDAMLLTVGKGRNRYTTSNYEGWESACPYGVPGDLLWVRETCRAHELTDAEVEKMEPPLGNRDRLYGLDGVVFAADEAFNPIKPTAESADAWMEMYHYRGKRGATVPPIHMPRWASRLTLRITEVRVQRLQDISDDDCVAEGVDGKLCASFVGKSPLKMGHAERVGFAALWESINGPGSWDANPFVWCISFETIRRNVDDVLKEAA